MKASGRLLVPTFRRAWDLAVAMPGTMLVAWFLTASIGVLSDIAFARTEGVGSSVFIIYGIALTFIQVWVTRDALTHLGFSPSLQIGNSLSVYLQGILIGLGFMLGFILLILPGLYVFSRWYLANTLLILHGSGRRATMQQSWDMLEPHWPAALGVGLTLVVVTLVPALIEFFPFSFSEEYGFATICAINVFSAVGVLGGYLAAAALLSLIEPATGELREIFG